MRCIGAEARDEGRQGGAMDSLEFALKNSPRFDLEFGKPGSGGLREYTEVLVDGQPWVISHGGDCQGFVLAPEFDFF